MPNGIHWEWRGFGRVSDDFRRAFECYPLRFEDGPLWDNTKDEYIWIPNSRINVKLRLGGGQQGLKLKRLVDFNGDVELWLEDPQELFSLDKLDQTLLNEVAGKLGLPAMNVPPGRLTPSQVLEIFRTAKTSAIVAAVHKKRQSRQAGPWIQVELVEILRVIAGGREIPLDFPVFSVAVENSTDLSNASPASLAAGRDAVLAIIHSLNLTSEALRPMNYLDAIAVWVGVGKSPRSALGVL